MSSTVNQLRKEIRENYRKKGYPSSEKVALLLKELDRLEQEGRLPAESFGEPIGEENFNE